LQKEDVDLAVAMAFYANGIPFNVARNRYWKRMIKKVAQAGGAYVPPHYNKLRSTLLLKVWNGWGEFFCCCWVVAAGLLQAATCHS
jgi:hypothetical protein